jgi:hypothetical protein
LKVEGEGLKGESEVNGISETYCGRRIGSNVDKN